MREKPPYEVIDDNDDAPRRRRPTKKGVPTWAIYASVACLLATVLSTTLIVINDHRRKGRDASPDARAAGTAPDYRIVIGGAPIWISPPTVAGIITSVEWEKEYRENVIAADLKYKKKRVRIFGYAYSIEQLDDIAGLEVVSDPLSASSNQAGVRRIVAAFRDKNDLIAVKCGAAGEQVIIDGLISDTQGISDCTLIAHGRDVFTEDSTYKAWIESVERRKTAADLKRQLAEKKGRLNAFKGELEASAHLRIGERDKQLLLDRLKVNIEALEKDIPPLEREIQRLES